MVCKRITTQYTLPFSLSLPLRVSSFPLLHIHNCTYAHPHTLAHPPTPAHTCTHLRMCRAATRATLCMTGSSAASSTRGLARASSPSTSSACQCVSVRVSACQCACGKAQLCRSCSSDCSICSCIAVGGGSTGVTRVAHVCLPPCSLAPSAPCTCPLAPAPCPYDHYL